jgi:Mg-chelatase subunit ChlD
MGTLIRVAFLVIISTSTFVHGFQVFKDCVSSAGYVEERNEAENATVLAINAFVTSNRTRFRRNTDNLDDSKVTTALHNTLQKFNKSFSEERASSFVQGISVVTKGYLQAKEIVQQPNAGDLNEIELKNEFENFLINDKIMESQGVFGKLLFVNNNPENPVQLEKKKRKKRQQSSNSTNSNASNTFDPIDVSDIEKMFFGSVDDIRYSVAFVIDDTGSMRHHIKEVQCLVQSFLTSDRNRPDKYILTTFNDPERNTMFFEPKVYSSSDTSDVQELLNDLSSIKPCCVGIGCRCGGDRPEYGMGGILRAIDKSLRYPDTGLSSVSHIILFTDAPAKDSKREEEVRKKLQSTRPDNGTDLVVHAFLSQAMHLSPHLCKNNSYVNVVEAQGGILVNSITKADSLKTFIKRYTKTYASELHLPSCASRSRRSAGRCRNFTLSTLATEVTFIINNPHGPMYVIIRNSTGIVQTGTLNGTQIHSFSSPISGNWSVCVGGPLDLNNNIMILVKNNFQFSVDFTIGNHSTIPLSKLPPPGCPVSALVFSPQYNELSNTIGTHALSMISLTGENLTSQTQLSNCNGYLIGHIIVPREPFYFRFQGSIKGDQFSSNQLTQYVPTPWSLVVTNITTPKNIIQGRSEVFIFSLNTTNKQPSCPLPIIIRATTGASGLILSVSPSEVTLRQSEAISINLTVTATNDASTGLQKIDLMLENKPSGVLETVAIEIKVQPQETCTRRHPDDHTCCDETNVKYCCPLQSCTRDLIFVIDGSRSLNKEKFTVVKNFTVGVLNHIQLGENLTRVAVIKYARKTQVEFGFNFSYDKANISNRIMDMARPKQDFGTVTDDALIKAANLAATEGRKQPHVTPTIALVTDGITGRNLTYIRAAVDQLDTKCILRFAVIAFNKNYNTNKDAKEKATVISGSDSRIFLGKTKDELLKRAADVARNLNMCSN